MNLHPLDSRKGGEHYGDGFAEIYEIFLVQGAILFWTEPFDRVYITMLSEIFGVFRRDPNIRHYEMIMTRVCEHSKLFLEGVVLWITWSVGIRRTVWNHNDD